MSENDFLKYNILNYLRKHSAKELYDYIDTVVYNKAAVETDMAANAAATAAEIVEAHSRNQELIKVRRDGKYPYIERNAIWKGVHGAPPVAGDIIAVAQSYGVTVRANKAKCPFHKDNNPSLVFYPKTSSFHCFGCGAAGTIVHFIARMEKIK